MFLQRIFSFPFYPFLLKGYFSLLASLCQTALIPIVGILKSRVQLYLILLVRYCPLWALEAGPHGFTFGFFPKRPRFLRRIIFGTTLYQLSQGFLLECFSHNIVEIVKSRVQFYLILLTFLCLISDVGLNLLSHILSLKLRTTFISYVSFITSPFFENVLPQHHRFHDLLTNLCLTSFFFFKGFRSYLKGILVFLQIFINCSDTNCWDC
ncbi:hypothetical protein IGI04_009161 [Brassica rapa subsp. trilocularis]|uniref:Uncharacterized protein n=1 Tax=Brassica rapa subsp. trilocularis TaxID=1813537 RepID=A0ABQ7MWP7_BRACM|nr:hypothetical protein IGI04_009161 [Brassica rapa subsp. trilocularis]